MFFGFLVFLFVWVVEIVLRYRVVTCFGLFCLRKIDGCCLLFAVRIFARSYVTVWLMKVGGFEV